MSEQSVWSSAMAEEGSLCEAGLSCYGWLGSRHCGFHGNVCSVLQTALLHPAPWLLLQCLLLCSKGCCKCKLVLGGWEDPGVS